MDSAAAGHPKSTRSPARSTWTTGILIAIIEGDTAFRTLYYFLEVLKPVLETVQPRSMLSLRSKPK